MAQSTVVQKVSGRNPNVLTVPDGQIATWHSSSTCCDEQRLGLCRRDSHSLLLVLALLLWVEGCCFPISAGFFGHLCALFCRMLVLSLDRFYTAYLCHWLTFFSGFHRAGCQFVLRYRRVQGGCHMVS